MKRRSRIGRESFHKNAAMSILDENMSVQWDSLLLRSNQAVTEAVLQRLIRNKTVTRSTPIIRG
jgi:hypothetical protein